MSFRFLSLNEVLFIHSKEADLVGHSSTIRDLNLLKSAIENTRLKYENGYVQDIFELATSYIRSIVMNHPFVDVNKRTGLATALVFLEFNGYIIKENSSCELADKVIALITREITDDELSKYLKRNAVKL